MTTCPACGRKNVNPVFMSATKKICRDCGAFFDNKTVVGTGTVAEQKLQCPECQSTNFYRAVEHERWCCKNCGKLFDGTVAGEDAALIAAGSSLAPDDVERIKSTTALLESLENQKLRSDLARLREVAGRMAGSLQRVADALGIATGHIFTPKSLADYDALSLHDQPAAPSLAEMMRDERWNDDWAITRVGFSSGDKDLREFAVWLIGPDHDEETIATGRTPEDAAAAALASAKPTGPAER